MTTARDEPRRSARAAPSSLATPLDRGRLRPGPDARPRLARRPAQLPDRRPVSAGRWRRTGPTRSCSSSTRWPSPLASALILVVMLEVISGGARPDYRAFVVVGSALWSFVLSGHQRPRLDRSSTTASATGCSSTSTSARATSSSVLLGRGVARIGVGGDGRRDHARRRRRLPRRPVRHRPDRLAAARRRDGPRLASILAIGLHPGGDLHADPPGVVVLPGGRRRARSSWSSGVVFPLAVLPTPVQAIGLVTPLTWWIEGVRRAPCSRAASARSAAPGSLCTELTGSDRRRAPRRSSLVLLATGSGGYTRGGGRVPGERPASEGSRAARPDDRLLIDSDRGPRRTPRPAR